ncbi:MAG TPA: hypothetical protein VH701_03455 [Vicinamibacterales bacterium]|jgi:hypothetical protein
MMSSSVSRRTFVATVLTSIALNSFIIVALWVLVVVGRLLVRHRGTKGLSVFGQDYGRAHPD